ncbi:response regulator [Actinoalloteichus hymeniacidonis]|uniref:Two component transcriptional regulator, LuxR family n=1 Tax=Actinoalloteichus hymeniacidonis TaxID=340345 RepID=A0AAC9MWP4_9PSEU|nr:response regulator transcription factor [Actinoalloteichus hymeniacidonis]AOS61530.1 two component transcriptional regulator, LuxR family [Actinoalloteichus hymeniacidonis]MBB5910462.1 DNA-binding NarL/FixJ family response regulator [Actinoalloteichus hymeniacidonis]
MTEPITKVLLVDDHPIVRDGLGGLIDTQPDLELVGEAANGQEALAQVRRKRPDLVITDLRMPGGDGIELIELLYEHDPTLPIMVLSTFGAAADVTAAMAKGATSYLLKDSTRQELFAAIRTTGRGESVLAPPVAALLVNAFRQNQGSESAPSPREREILALIADGRGNQQISRALRISVATVKTHLTRLYAKLGVADRAAAVGAAYRRGWLTDVDDAD